MARRRRRRRREGARWRELVVPRARECVRVKGEARRPVMRERGKLRVERVESEMLRRRRERAGMRVSVWRVWVVVLFWSERWRV